MKALLIAEKPGLARKIESAYNHNSSKIPYELTVVAQRGHLFTLKSPNEIDKVMEQWIWETLPFYPEEHGGWKYKVSKEQSNGKYPTPLERFNNIKSTYNSGSFDFIIHAGDADREGELLVWETLSAIKNTLPVKRFWPNDETESTLVDALMNLREYEGDPYLVNLKDASYGRQHADYIIGMNLSRAATLAMMCNVSIGRVMSLLLAMVCRRELEIINFKPSTSYGIKSLYNEGFSGQYFVESSDAAESGDEDDSNEDTGLIYFATKKEADDFIASLGNTATVISFTKKETKTTAPKLFTLATAQIEGGKYGYSADRTLEIIQSLYEKNYISYPRTDCEYISSKENLGVLIESAKGCPAIVQNASTITEADIQRIKKTKKYVNDKALESHGHSGLIPTNAKPNWDSLNKDEKIIYEMIARRFIAIFLPPIIQEKTQLICDINGNTFKSNGKTLVDAGFSVIFGTKFTDMIIPEHNSGDVITVDGFDVAEKTTRCPSRYTSSTLVQACENPKKYLNDEALKNSVKEFRIGTPATRSSIIRDLVERYGYLCTKAKGKEEYLMPSKVGMQIYENIKTTILCQVDVTAEWDMMLDDIVQGNISLEQFESKIKRDNEAILEQFKNTKMKPVDGAKGLVEVGDCPKCGSPILSGKKGFFCKEWKKDGSGCDFTVYGYVCESKITDNEFKKLLGKEHIIKKVKYKGKSWDQELFLNEESKIEWVNKNADFTPTHTGIACPLCGKDIITTPWGFKCEGNEGEDKGCKFSIGEICKIKLTEDDLADLVINKKTKVIDGFVSKKGKKFSAHLCLNDDKGLKFEFPDTEENQSRVLKICPKCGADIVADKFSYHCSNDACTLSLARYIAKKWLSDDDIEKIFVKKKSGLIKGFKSKAGKSFDAYIKWDGDSKYEFEFPIRKKR